jgi:hypothetical protein
MPRLAVLICAACLAALALPSAAPAQKATPTPTPQPGGNFGALPPASQPEVTATPTPADSSIAQEDTDRRLLFAIGGGLLLLFVGIGYVITRDARTSLPGSARAAAARPRDEGPHRHARQTKAKARAKGKAQKAARRANRPSR